MMEAYTRSNTLINGCEDTRKPWLGHISLTVAPAGLLAFCNHDPQPKLQPCARGSNSFRFIRPSLGEAGRCVKAFRYLPNEPVLIRISTSTPSAVLAPPPSLLKPLTISLAPPTTRNTASSTYLLSIVTSRNHYTSWQKPSTCKQILMAYPNG